MSLPPFIEYVHFDDAEGVTGQNHNFLTLASSVDWNNWDFSVSFTERDTEIAAAADTDEFQFQASVGYRFDLGLGLNLGWLISNEGGIETRKVGAMLAYDLAFQRICDRPIISLISYH